MKKTIATFGILCFMLTSTSVGKELTVSDVPFTPDAVTWIVHPHSRQSVYHSGGRLASVIGYRLTNGSGRSTNSIDGFYFDDLPLGLRTEDVPTLTADYLVDEFDWYGTFLDGTSIDGHVATSP